MASEITNFKITKTENDKGAEWLMPRMEMVYQLSSNVTFDGLST